MSIKMNIIYVTVPSFLDLEISLIRELSRLANIKVLLIVQPESMHSSAFSLEKIMKRPCIVPATKYDGMQKYKDLIDLNVWDIANNPDNSFISCWNLSKLIKEYIKDGNFDIIHCTTKCKTMLFLQAYIKGLNNTLYTLHDPIPHAKASIIKEWVIDRYYNIYKNYLILSKLHKPIMEKIAPNKKTYISALGPYDFLNHYKTSVNSYGEYMLFIGKILHYKGVDILIKAYNKSNKAKLGIKLVIAGKGKIDGIEQLELNDNIILINRYIENEELASLISNCRFGVLPYRSATQSGVLMSFYAFNKPVIATRVGDFTQSIDDNKTGILCDANSVDSLAKAIDKMIACPIDTFTNNIYDQYNNKGDNSWSKIAFNLVTIYKRITNKQY